MTLTTRPHTCRPRARAYPSYIKDSVQKAIYDSALVFGVPYATLLSIARCESALNPKASNGSHFGLYQFAPATFRRAASQMRQQIGVLAHTYWSALDSSYTAGYMFVTGSASSWSCISAITEPTG
jgi:soluble lytic murein transglycosylase-like protein